MSDHALTRASILTASFAHSLVPKHAVHVRFVSGTIWDQHYVRAMFVNHKISLTLFHIIAGFSSSVVVTVEIFDPGIPSPAGM
jgi:hypothetical protein